MAKLMEQHACPPYPTSWRISSWMLVIPALLCHSLLITELSCGAIGASPSLEIAIPDKVIYVNNQHPQADDSNRGIEEELPVKTIAAATEIAMLNHKVSALGHYLSGHIP